MRGFSGSVPYLRYLCKRFDIIAISEHWLHSNKLSRFEEISDECAFHAVASKFASADNYGTKRGQGGVAIIWKKTIGGISKIDSLIHDRICGLRLQTRCNRVLNIFSVYLPSQGSPECYSACLDDLCEVMDTCETGSSSIVCGDMNGDMGALGGPRGNGIANRNGKYLVEFVDQYNLKSANLSNMSSGSVGTYFGPYGSTTIDHILVPLGLSNVIVHSQVLGMDPENLSDHRPVTADLNIGALIPNLGGSMKPKIRRWDKWTRDELTAKYTVPVDCAMTPILTFLERDDVSKTDIDLAIERIVAILDDASSVVPCTNFRKHLKPFWNEKLSLLKKDKVQKFRDWVNAGRPRGPTHPEWVEHVNAEKTFRKEMRRLDKSYENHQVDKVIESATADRNIFWRLLKKQRSPTGQRVLAVRNDKDEVVYDIDSVLEVWRSHFSALSTPKANDDYDNDHFNFVNEKVAEYNELDDVGMFLEQRFTYDEIDKAISKLHLRKACGEDCITTEHILYGGRNLRFALTRIFNLIVELEYVPVNLKVGIQIPLYKGKNLCSLSTDSYRGITLLNNFNKIYEILLWGRMHDWWDENVVISRLQGAGRKGQSCLHTALLLQETVSDALDTRRNVFVSYFDVSKAFDTVWTNGLFYKMYKMGIRGKMWRLMYRAYQGFMCKVRIEGKTSGWYPMLCGIHQGGFLSLTKYVAFINELIVELEESDLCCRISGISTSPVGYADDLATATLSKRKTDRVHDLVYEYGNRWRFQFNAGKSAVLVFGESKNDHDRFIKDRVFKLGSQRVKEKSTYDHVGVKSCLFKDDELRVEEKISKGRKTLNAASGLGIRKNGLNIITCNKIFWSVVVPTLLFGCELWILSDKDKENLLAFQRYAGRRIQRFPQRSPNASCFFGLGWMKLTTFIMAKKAIFVMSIVRNVDCILYGVLLIKLRQYMGDRERGSSNPHRSIFFDIFNTCARLDVLHCILDMVDGNEPVMSKQLWSRLVWQQAWTIEDAYWESANLIMRDNDLIMNTQVTPNYLVWWHLSDAVWGIMNMCETMAKLICHASRLKMDDCSLKDKPSYCKACSNCDMCLPEDLYHILMQCPFNRTDVDSLMRNITSRYDNVNRAFVNEPGEVFYWLLGKPIPNIEIDQMNDVRILAGTGISKIYRKVLMTRTGVG